MQRFINPNGLQVIPRSFTFNTPNGSVRLVWPNDRQTFENYYSALRALLRDNGVPDNQLPSSEQVQADMCSRVPQGCTSEQPYRGEVNMTAAPNPSGGCSSCGQRFG